MSGALSRAAIAKMPLDEFERRHDEIMRWTAAGAKDGEAAPDLERPDGHVYTRAEIGAMSEAEYEANRGRIHAQLQNGGIT